MPSRNKSLKTKQLKKSSKSTLSHNKTRLSSQKPVSFTNIFKNLEL